MLRHTRSTNTLSRQLLLPSIDSRMPRPSTVSMSERAARELIAQIGVRASLAKHAVLVPVQRAGFAVLFDVRTRRFKVAEGRFYGREMQRYQPTGRIVDVHKQRAGWSPFLEPPAIAAIDLDQFTQAHDRRPAAGTTFSGRCRRGTHRPASVIRRLTVSLASRIP